MLTKGEFVSYANYLGRIQEMNLDVEYKPNCGFFEYVDKKHIAEFFQYGYMTIGEWRLWSDLEISKVNKKKPENRSILECTDGNNYDLPYFDRLIQKYLYLKNNPELIKKIGLRSFYEEEKKIRTKLLKPAHSIKPKEIITTYQELIKKKKFERRKNQNIKIKDPPEWVEHIFKQLMRNRYSIRRLKKGMLAFYPIGIPRRYYYSRRIKRKKWGSGISIIKLRPFKHFMIDLVEENGKKYGLQLEDNQKEILHILGSIVNPGKLTRQFEKSNITDPLLLKTLKLPIGVIVIIETKLKDINVFDVIQYYEKHPEYRDEIKVLKKCKMEKLLEGVENNV